MAFAEKSTEKEAKTMAEIINWVQTQNQEKLAAIQYKKVLAKTHPLKVLDKLEKAYDKNDVKELVFWLAYAKFYGFGFTVKEGRKFFKKIKELWPSDHHCELANAFHFLNKSYAQDYTERTNSDQIYNYGALAAEFSYC